MRIARGKVVSHTEEAEGFELDEQSEQELMEADASIESGEGISAEELFKRLALLRAS